MCTSRTCDCCCCCQAWVRGRPVSVRPQTAYHHPPRWDGGSVGRVHVHGSRRCQHRHQRRHVPAARRVTRVQHARRPRPRRHHRCAHAASCRGPGAIHTRWARHYRVRAGACGHDHRHRTRAPRHQPGARARRVGVTPVPAHAAECPVRAGVHARWGAHGSEARHCGRRHGPRRLPQRSTRAPHHRRRYPCHCRAQATLLHCRRHHGWHRQGWSVAGGAGS